VNGGKSLSFMVNVTRSSSPSPSSLSPFLLAIMKKEKRKNTPQRIGTPFLFLAAGILFLVIFNNHRQLVADVIRKCVGRAISIRIGFRGVGRYMKRSNRSCSIKKGCV